MLLTKKHIPEARIWCDIFRLATTRSNHRGHKLQRADSVQIHPPGSSLEWRGEKEEVYFDRCCARLSINCPAADSIESINSICSGKFDRNSVKCIQLICVKLWLQGAPQVDRPSIWYWMVHPEVGELDTSLMKMPIRGTHCSSKTV